MWQSSGLDWAPMIRKDSGVVLKSSRSGETSKLVTFLGRESGKIRLLAKGAYSPKSPFRSSLEPGSVLEVVFYHKEGRTLYFLKEVHIQGAVTSERESLAGMAALLAVLELLNQVCYWDSPEAQIVDLVIEYLGSSGVRDPLAFFLVFEYRLLEILGALPDFASCATCAGPLGAGFYHPGEGESLCTNHSTATPHRVPLDGETLAFIGDVAGATLSNFATRGVDARLRKRFGKIMHWTYTFHVQGYSLPEALKLITIK